jgi:hypothetical protein
MEIERDGERNKRFKREMKVREIKESSRKKGK